MRPQADSGPYAGAVFRILSIDGGGIRGLIPALLLEQLEVLLEQALQSAGEHEAASWRERGIVSPRIANCFHLIAGTSTGGLLTAALTTAGPGGHPKLTAAEAVSIYEKQGPAIFSLPLWRRILNPFGLLRPRYPLAQLRRVLEREALFGSAKLADACTDVLIASYDTIHTAPRLFTRWGAPGSKSIEPGRSELSMAEVALATSAAPTYFEPEDVEGTHLIDGGVYAANPAIVAVSMALRRTERPAPTVPADLLMISLGTGSWERPLDYGKGGVLGWVRPRKGGEPLLEAILDGQADSASESAHMILNGWSPPGGQTWWESTLPPALIGGGPRFWRYQPNLPDPLAMDDVGSIPTLRRIGLESASHYEQELRRLARLLVSSGPV